MINDAHCHFFSTPFFGALGGDAALTKLEWDPPGTAQSLADRWVAELDRHRDRAFDRRALGRPERFGCPLLDEARGLPSGEQFTVTVANCESEPSFEVATSAVLLYIAQLVLDVAAVTCTVRLASEAMLIG